MLYSQEVERFPSQNLPSKADVRSSLEKGNEREVCGRTAEKSHEFESSRRKLKASTTGEKMSGQ